MLDPRHLLTESTGEISSNTKKTTLASAQFTGKIMQELRLPGKSIND